MEKGNYLGALLASPMNKFQIRTYLAGSLIVRMNGQGGRRTQTKIIVYKEQEKSAFLYTPALVLNGHTTKTIILRKQSYILPHLAGSLIVRMGGEGGHRLWLSPHVGRCGDCEDLLQRNRCEYVRLINYYQQT